MWSYLFIVLIACWAIGAASQEQRSGYEERRCPLCSTPRRFAAKFCGHCGHRFDWANERRDGC